MTGAGAPVFIIGAGFNVDARRSGIQSTVECRYPLMSDIAMECFGIEDAESVEQLFQDAINSKNQAPLECFFDDMIMKADYYLAGSMVDDARNIYNVFLDRYPQSDFITFNYDSLIEILLMRKRRWRPDNGYGVCVKVGFDGDAQIRDYDYNTSNLVLHLHGTLAVATQETFIDPGALNGVDELKLLDEPQFSFDPDSIGFLFPRIARTLSSPSHEYTWERCIAPVPEKASQFVRPFINRVREAARQAAKDSSCAVSIGYRFSESDSDSFNFLLQELHQQSRTLYVVDPSADEICTRLESIYRIRCVPMSISFLDWAGTSWGLPDKSSGKVR